jgi:hypothetical protein
METKLERNFERYVILSLTFFIVSATSIFGSRRYSDYREIQRQRDWEDKYFKRVFGSIQPSQGGVAFYLNPGSTYFSIPSQQNPSRPEGWERGYRSFSEGGTFEFRDICQYGASHKIVRIESDGVIVGYVAGAGRGRVKLA